MPQPVQRQLRRALFDEDRRECNLLDVRGAAEVVDQVGRREEVEGRQPSVTSRVVVVAVDGEDRQLDVVVWVLVVDLAVPGRGKPGQKASRVLAGSHSPARLPRPLAPSLPDAPSTPPALLPLPLPLAGVDRGQAAHLPWKFVDWSLTTSSLTSLSPRQWSRRVSMQRCSALRDGLLSWKRSPASSTISTCDVLPHAV